MADKPELPQRFLTAATLAAAVGSRKTAMVEIGMKLVNAVNRVAAAIEHQNGNGDQGTPLDPSDACDRCRSLVSSFTAGGDRQYCVACGDMRGSDGE